MESETDLKKETQKLKEDIEILERYIEDFTAFLPIAVCNITPAGIITFINRAFQDLTDYKEIDIVGEPVETLFWEKKEAEKILIKASKEKVIQNKELTLVSKEKEKFSVNVFISKRKDKEGNLIGYFLGMIDVCELKKLQGEMEKKIAERTKSLEESRRALINILEDVEAAKERAEEEKNKTLAIITNFADGLLVFDRGNKLILVNQKAEDFFNIKSENLIGQPFSELGAFPALLPLINLIGKEIKEVFRKELTIKEDLTMEVSTIPLISRKEKLGTIIILHDVTREKTIEKMKTEFVSLAAHQLRTPISAIKWTLRMLLDGDLGAITDEQRDFIEKTYRSNERMTNLINDLLNVTRIEEGRYLHRPTLSDIEPIVQSVINSYGDEIKRKNLKLIFKKPEEKLPEVKVDIEKIKLVIENLLDNAIRYTPIGGEITVSLKLREKEIEFSVKDTGVGIPKDQQERVFTKFFRGINITRLETEGSGLGLFITKNIIKAHGGRIWFKSEEGRGATFFFTLPVKKEVEEFLKEF